MLVFSHVSRYYPNGVALFRDLSFYIHAGESICFSGPPRSGKSHLLKMILGYEHPTSGMVLFRHKNWAQLSPKERIILYRDIGIMGSPATLLPDRTVFETLALPLKLRGYKGKALKNRIESTLFHLELHDHRSDRVGILSWNEQYRLSMGRALVHRPLLVLADNPLTCFKEHEECFFEWINRIRPPETTLICTETEPMLTTDRVYLLSSEQWIHFRE